MDPGQAACQGGRSTAEHVFAVSQENPTALWSGNHLPEAQGTGGSVTARAGEVPDPQPPSQAKQLSFRPCSIWDFFVRLHPKQEVGAFSRVWEVIQVARPIRPQCNPKDGKAGMDGLQEIRPPHHRPPCPRRSAGLPPRTPGKLAPRETSESCDWARGASAGPRPVPGPGPRPLERPGPTPSVPWHVGLPRPRGDASPSEPGKPTGCTHCLKNN